MARRSGVMCCYAEMVPSVCRLKGNVRIKRGGDADRSSNRHKKSDGVRIKRKVR